MKLLNNATAKKIPETVFTIAVVLGSSKLIPIANKVVMAVNKNVPKLKSNLFSLL